MRFDRRRLLQWVPPGLAGLLLPRGAEAVGQTDEGNEASAETPVASYDVAVVGGGVAGCYTAYRLLNGELEPGSPLAELAAKHSDGKLKVALFEYSGRVGGRLLAAELPKINDDDPAARKVAEFGGFRFQPQMHIVADLAQHLGLDQEPFPVDEPPQNHIRLRRKTFFRGDMKVDELPYDFDINEKNLFNAGGDFGTFVENQAFAGTLPDTNNTANNPALAPYPGPKEPPKPGGPRPGPNGYIFLRTQYHAAFQAEDWETVKVLREQYEAAKQKAAVDGRLITDWSWWSLLTRFLTTEAVAYLEDSGGYNNLWSAGSVATNLVDDFYFAEPADVYPKIYATGTVEEQVKASCTQTAWKHITSGYSDIPNKLYQGFLAKGGTGYLQRQLLDFDKDGQGGYNLRFFQRESGTLDSAQGENQCTVNPASCQIFNANHVVLAMPKRSMELLDQGNFFFLEPTVQQLLDSVLNNPAIRIFMAYDRPWWTEAIGTETFPPPTCGRSTTDLQVRQFYYWHTAEDGGPSFVLASYSNGQAERYWHGLQEGPGPYDQFKGTVPPSDPPRFDAAQGRGPRAGSTEMGRLAHEQLVEVVGPFKKGFKPPRPYYVHFQNWTKDPWGAGWHGWTAGNNDNQLIPQILQPLPGERVYICGEAYSNVQGWVQGALNTSEVLLQKKLGLAYPSWLSSGGTWLGPGSEGIPST